MLIWEQALILKSSACQHPAATQFPMLYVHDAKPVTVFDFHTLKYCLGQSIPLASRLLVVVLTYLRN